MGVNQLTGPIPEGWQLPDSLLVSVISRPGVCYMRDGGETLAPPPPPPTTNHPPGKHGPHAPKSLLFLNVSTCSA